VVTQGSLPIAANVLSKVGGFLLPRMSWKQKHFGSRGNGWSGGQTRIAALGGLCFALVIFAAAGQSRISSELPDSTEDRVAAKGWWPTKATASINTFAGANACGECHFQETSTQPDTAMANAALRLSGGIKSREPASGTFENGAYSYQFLAEHPGYSLEVKSVGQSISFKIGWTFGAGIHGQTFLLESNGELYEGQVSSFSSTHRMDLTPGHTQAEEGSLQNAIGIRLEGRGAAQCFACHTTAWSTGFKLASANAIPGIHCEACHGPGIDHISAVKTGQIDKARKAILNPTHLTPTSSIDFCGACHKTTTDVILHASALGTSSIRFQPYRLEESRCWLTTKDVRLTCIACHNPHEPLVRDSGFYDQKCLSCHSLREHARHEYVSRRSASTPAICPKATADCSSCHMPKYNVPEMHSLFTDHFIRVVRPGELYPN
jgi:hypothetical protein